MKNLSQIRFQNQQDLSFEIARYSNDVVIIADCGKRIVYANPIACRKTGYRLKELLGQKLPILYRKENQAKYTARVLKPLRDSGRWRGEVEMRKKDGSTFSVETVTVAYYDDEGNPAGTIDIGKDLTHERLLSQRSMEQEHRLQGILESMEDAVCVCDRQGKILMVNSAHSRMLGYRKDEIIGAKSPYPWVDPVDVGKSRDLFKRVQRKGSVINVPLVWRRRDNRRVMVSVAMSRYVNSPRGIEGQVCTIRDVTDVQYAEELRRARDQIQRLVFDVKQKSVRLQTLEETNTLVLDHANVTRIFHEITDGVKKLVPHDLAGIYVYDSRQENMFPHTLSRQTAFSRELAEFPLKMGQGIIGEAALTGRMVWVNDAHLDPRSIYPQEMKPECEHFIAVPLKAKNAIFGILVVARHREPKFIEEEAEVIKSFADAASVALENARMISLLTQEQQHLSKAMFTDVVHLLRSGDIAQHGSHNSHEPKKSSGWRSKGAR
ncbi:MAG TPA: PAS domain S-box protein [Bacteroidota bacterium]|jgi:PAS domain S-box-containing protein|nr:PAS domain S-box protein [Bacteroidota bacterium]